MTRPFTSDEFEHLALEARGQFDWAREDGDASPEGLAFIVDGRIIGGHSRSGFQTAAAHAIDYLVEAFGGAANNHPPIPSRVIMVTAPDKDGAPTIPSEACQRELRAIAGHPVLITVLGDPGSKAQEFRLD
jgi:hypothetical protein